MSEKKIITAFYRKIPKTSYDFSLVSIIEDGIYCYIEDYDSIKYNNIEFYSFVLFKIENNFIKKENVIYSFCNCNSKYCPIKSNNFDTIDITNLSKLVSGSIFKPTLILIPNNNY